MDTSHYYLQVPSGCAPHYQRIGEAELWPMSVSVRPIGFL